MNAKTELTGRIMALVYDEIRPDTQRVIDVLKDYQVEYSSGLEEMEFSRIVAHFIGAKRAEGFSDRSADNYRLYLDLFGGFTNKMAKDITTNDIRDFLAYLSETRHLKTISIQTVINILRSFFSWLVMEEVITKNPMNKIRNYQIDKKDSRHALTTEELERLRDACQTYREKALLEFMVSSGCRVSELTSIQADRVDFVHRSVDVIGKGSKPRTLYFSVRAMLMIQEYLKERKGGTALFSGIRKPYGDLSNAAIQRIVKLLGQRARLSKQVHPHILRHTFATQLVNSGCDIVVIQQLLGHTNVNTTQIYAELSKSSVRRAYDQYIA
ncbi:MAG: site-specific tyrosine recombinase/integron integrase [Oscillospiraceae bacterium]